MVYSMWVWSVLCRCGLLNVGVVLFACEDNGSPWIDQLNAI